MENKQPNEQLVSANNILEATKNEHKKGAQRLKTLKRTTAIVSIIGLAISFYSSIFHLPGQVYNNTDKNVASAFSENPTSGNQENLRDLVGEKIANSIFEPVYIYENGSHKRENTGFAIEKIEVTDTNFMCITTMLQSHGELSSNKMLSVGIRLPGTDEDIMPITQIIDSIPHDENLNGSGWDFVALCFENESINKLANLSYVGVESFDQYKVVQSEKLISIGLPRVLERNNIPQIFLSEHVPYTSNIIIGGEGAQGESGGIVYSKTRKKIIGTILSSPNLKNSLHIQSINNIDQFLSNYNNFKTEVLKLWNN